jgi:hypothetical protein
MTRFGPRGTTLACVVIASIIIPSLRNCDRQRRTDLVVSMPGARDVPGLAQL